MSELEMTVEALKRCVPADVFARAVNEVMGIVNHRVNAPVSVKLNLNKEIHSTLLELGVPASIKGYRYIVYALELVMENEDILEAITKGLYPAVAEKFQTTAPKVERAIRHAVELVFVRCDLIVLDSYFGNTYSRNKGKTTNGEFLAAVANHIRLRMSE